MALVLITLLLESRSLICHSEPAKNLSFKIMKTYYTYILSSYSRTLYVGVTNDLERRVYEHKNKLIDGFTARYNIDKLVHFESCVEIDGAIAREKELKGWLRKKKIELIEATNPNWNDLSESWRDPS